MKAPDFFLDAAIVARDAFENLTKGIRSSVRDTRFVAHSGLNEDALSLLVDHNWLARKIVRALPEAAHQNEILWANDADKDRWAEINAIEWNNDGALLTAAFLARTHGVSMLILAQDFGGDLAQPFSERVPVNFLEVVPSRNFQVHPQDKAMDGSRRQGLPELYTIEGDHRLRGQKVHHSRCVMFYGPTLSDIDTSRDKDKLQQASVLDAVWDALQQYGLTWESAAQLMYQASVGVWTMKGLIRSLSSNAKEVGARLELQSNSISSFKTILLDAEGNESFDRKAVNFGEIPEMEKMQILQIAAAADIPVSELFGRIIAGLGDVGTTEDKRWIRKVDGYRTSILAPALRRIMPGAEFSFPPIDTPPQKEQLETLTAAWKMSAITQDEVRGAVEKIFGLGPLSPAGKQELYGKLAPVPPADPAGPDDGEDPAADPDTDA